VTFSRYVCVCAVYALSLLLPVVGDGVSDL
jgi:hypothetical protein